MSDTCPCTPRCVAGRTLGAGAGAKLSATRKLHETASRAVREGLPKSTWLHTGRGAAPCFSNAVQGERTREEQGWGSGGMGEGGGDRFRLTVCGTGGG